MISSTQGVVFVYQYSSITNAWTQLGGTIIYPIHSEHILNCGRGLEISATGHRVIVGAMLEDSYRGCIYNIYMILMEFLGYKYR